MDRALAGDLARLPQLLQSARDFAVREVGGLSERPVARLDAAPAPRKLPPHGVGTDGALARFAERWAPGFSGSAGPRYLGLVTRGAPPAPPAGDRPTGAYRPPRP